MKVELEPGVWLSDGEGDPPRTTDKENAKEFRSMSAAHAAIKEAREYRPFKAALVEDDFF